MIALTIHGRTQYMTADNEHAMKAELIKQLSAQGWTVNSDLDITHLAANLFGVDRSLVQLHDADSDLCQLAERAKDAEDYKRKLEEAQKWRRIYIGRLRESGYSATMIANLAGISKPYVFKEAAQYAKKTA